MRVTATTLRNRLLSRARLRHLQVFVKVAELRTVKRAAESVGITQPSATQALGDLEQLLGLRLFLRHSQGMLLTPAGLALLPLVRKALGQIDELATETAALAHGSNAVVRVAAISAAIGGGLGDAVAAFAHQHPYVLVHLEEADAARQAGLLADGELDCAVCRVPAVLPSGWSFTPLWPDRFAIVAGRLARIETLQPRRVRCAAHGGQRQMIQRLHIGQHARHWATARSAMWKLP